MEYNVSQFFTELLRQCGIFKNKADGKQNKKNLNDIFYFIYSEYIKKVNLTLPVSVVVTPV